MNLTICLSAAFLILSHAAFCMPIRGQVKAGNKGLSHVVITDGINFTQTDTKGNFLLDTDQEVAGHAARRVRDRVDHVLDLERLGAEQRLIVDMLFRFLHDLGHGLHSSDRIFARRRLTGEHDGARAVIDRVGNVGNLRPRRARIVDHGFEHFRGRNDALAEQTALGNEILLAFRLYTETCR